MRVFTLLTIIVFFPAILFAQRRAKRIAPASDSAAVIAVPPQDLTPLQDAPPETSSPRAALIKNKSLNKPVKKADTTLTRPAPVATTTTNVKPVVASKPPVQKLPPSRAVYTARVNTIFHKLGDDLIRIKVFQYGDAKEPFFINVHDDEITAVSGAKRILEGSGGVLIKIENDGQRNIRFRMDKKTYTFDPNRIFSHTGIIQTLNMLGGSDAKSIAEIEKFAERILRLLPVAPSCIIALHNNSDGKFSITSYMYGREREKDAKAMNARPGQDPDDLFLTTDSSLFYKLRKEKFNVVWQDNANAFKDGSLSIYCGEKNICYLNCETEHGKLSQYWEMISTAAKYLKKPVTETIVYNYKLSSGRDSSHLPDAYDIYFGEKKIGTTKIVNDQAQLEVAKTFPLYDNMDLVYFKSRTSGPKIELRIDPTKTRVMHDPEKDVIVIKVMP